MTEDLAKLIDTSKLTISVAYDLLQACHQKDNNVYTHPKNVISFLFRRALEMFETITILIKEGRLIDSALMLRSLIEMQISLGYIFAKDIDKPENNKRALKYLLNGDRQQRDLLIANLEEFKKSDPNIEARKAEIEAHIEEMEEDFKNEYGDEHWKLPCIKQRAKLSNYRELLDAYNLSYKDLSSIEHHNFFFGQHYVDTEKCRPRKEIILPEQLTQFRPKIILYYFRDMFLNILSVFESEYVLESEKKIKELRSLHEEEYGLLKNK